MAYLFEDCHERSFWLTTSEAYSSDLNCILGLFFHKCWIRAYHLVLFPLHSFLRLRPVSFPSSHSTSVDITWDFFQGGQVSCLDHGFLLPLSNISSILELPLNYVSRCHLTTTVLFLLICLCGTHEGTYSPWPFD